MSPEERAEAWLKEQCIYKPHLYVECLASAIRAAENDALERVVGVLVGCWCDEYGGMTREEAEATSEVVLIRSLQSKPPEGK